VRQILVKLPNIKFHEYPLSGSRSASSIRYEDGHRDLNLRSVRFSSNLKHQPHGTESFLRSQKLLTYWRNSHILWNLNFHHCVHKGLPLICSPSQMNLVHTPNLFSKDFNIFFPSMSSLPSDSFLSVPLPDSCMHSSPLRATYPISSSLIW
jgi:hypothetical protein